MGEKKCLKIAFANYRFSRQGAFRSSFYGVKRPAKTCRENLKRRENLRVAAFFTNQKTEKGLSI